MHCITSACPRRQGEKTPSQASTRRDQSVDTEIEENEPERCRTVLFTCMPPQKRHKGRGGAYHGRDGRQPQRDAESAPLNDIPANATVQAFEAQLVYGRSERFHELFDVSGGTEAGPSRARGALVRLQIEDQVDGDTPGRELWVDR